MKLQPAMVEAAIKAGVTHFYASEWNSDISQLELSGMRYFRDKQMTRAHLAARAKENPDFKYTLFVTGIFTEWSTLEFFGFDHENATAAIYGRPDARVGVTSIPEYVACLLTQIEADHLGSIARYTVESLLIPFKSTNPTNPSERTIRVCGSSQPFSTLVDALSKASGHEYKVAYLDPAGAAEKQEQARLAGDELGEMMWSIRPLVASGYGVADGNGELDNRLFDWRPETVEETFQRVYAGTRS
jgi:NmrA-like family